MLGPNFENIRVVQKVGSKTKMWDVGCDRMVLPSIITYLGLTSIRKLVNGPRTMVFFVFHDFFEFLYFP